MNDEYDISTADDAEIAAATATAGTDPSTFVSFYPFTMDKYQGLTMVKQAIGKNARVQVWQISAPFELLGRVRDPHGLAWGKLLSFRDADGRIHEHHVTDAALHGEASILCGALAHKGLYINPSRRKELVEYLSGVKLTERVTIVSRTGWHDIGGHPAFVLPDDKVALPTGEAVTLDAVAYGPYDRRGTIDDWKAGVGTLCLGHALPMFMVSAALAGPLLHLVGAEGGGVHIFGPSSIGKSAVLAAAASVWGAGGIPGYVRSWRATANGLEGAAASATDTCLVLDELGLCDPRDVAAAVYALANGSGKSRAQRDGSLREPKTWRVLVLSSGELPVETKINEDRGGKTRAGQLVRLLDIPADRGFGFGAFDHAGGHVDAGKLADALKQAATTAYGCAGIAFVRELVRRGIGTVAPLARKFATSFNAGVVAQPATEQVNRAANKFALIALAGEMAAKAGIVPWPQGAAENAARTAFASWLDKRGGDGSHEERQAVEQVRHIMERHGESRFECVNRIPGNILPVSVQDRFGWRQGEGANREWWVQPETWKTVFCGGLDASFVARTLHAKGMLRRQGGNHLTCVVPINNRSHRVYVLTAAILD